MIGSLLPVLAIIAATALGATSGLFVKGLALSSFTLTAYRAIIPVVFLLPLMLKRRTVLGRRGSRKILWTASAFNAARVFCFILAFKYTEIGNAIVLFYTWPVFALIIHSLQNKKKLGARELLVVMMAFIGALIMNMHRNFGTSGKDVTGSLLMLAAALLYGIVSTLFKKGLENVDELEGLYFQNIAGAVIFLPFLFIDINQTTIADGIMAAVYGLTVGILAFWFFFYALKRLSLAQYGAFAYMEVFFALLYGTLFLGEQINANMAVGGIVVLVASFLARRIDSTLHAD